METKYTAEKIVEAMNALLLIKGDDLSERFYDIYPLFNDIWEPKSSSDVYDTIKSLVDGFNKSLLKEYKRTGELPKDWFHETECIKVGIEMEDGCYRVYIEFRHGEYIFI